MHLRASEVNKIFLMSATLLSFHISISKIQEGCKTTKNAHGITPYSMKYIPTHELHMAGKETKKMRQVGATAWHDYTFYLGGGRKNQVKWYNIIFLIKPEFYNFCSAAFCCFCCISSLCSCSNVSSETPS